MNNIERYTKYYHDQAGSGISTVFRGSTYQRGHGGIGSFLKGLFRIAFPLFKSGAKAVGHEALRTGANILSDISADKPMKQVLKDRLEEAGNSLQRKAAAGVARMSGSGLKATKRRRINQSVATTKRRKTSKQRGVVRKKSAGVKRTIKKKKKAGKKLPLRSLRDIFA
jgi:hypothetical protein